MSDNDPQPPHLAVQRWGSNLNYFITTETKTKFVVVDKPEAVIVIGKLDKRGSLVPLGRCDMPYIRRLGLTPGEKSDVKNVLHEAVSAQAVDIQADPWIHDKEYFITKKGGYLVKQEGTPGDEDIVVYGKADGDEIVALDEKDKEYVLAVGMLIYRHKRSSTNSVTS